MRFVSRTVIAAAALSLLAGALKSTRAQQPDRSSRAPKPVPDSPFAALSVLAAPAPARRKRPRQRRKPA